MPVNNLKNAEAEKLTTWSEALLGTAPILVWIVIQLLGYYVELNPTSIKAILFFGVLGLIMLAGLALFFVGVKRGFPLWSISYTAYLILALILLPSFRLLPTQMMPFWTVSIILLIITLLLIFRLRNKLVLLWKKIQKNSTIISFALYNFLPFSMLVFADETNHNFMLPFQILSYSILGIGSFLYLHARSDLLRFLSLTLCAYIALVINLVSIEIYWSSVGISSDYTISLIASLVITVIVAAPIPLTWLLRKTRFVFK